MTNIATRNKQNKLLFFNEKIHECYPSGLEFWDDKYLASNLDQSFLTPSGQHLKNIEQVYIFLAISIFFPISKIGFEKTFLSFILILPLLVKIGSVVLKISPECVDRHLNYIYVYG